MQIIGIVGIIDLPRSEDRVWRNLRVSFQKEFPGASFRVEHCFYLPWHTGRMRELHERVRTQYDTREETILVGYSLGGTIACAVAGAFSKSPVRAVVTIGTPHRLSWLYKEMGFSALHCAVPVLSFSGVLDVFVPWFMTSYPGAALHRWLYTDHLLSFLVSQKPAQIIAHTTHAFLTQAPAVASGRTLR